MINDHLQWNSAKDVCTRQICLKLHDIRREVIGVVCLGDGLLDSAMDENRILIGLVLLDLDQSILFCFDYHDNCTDTYKYLQYYHSLYCKPITKPVVLFDIDNAIISERFTEDSYSTFHISVSLIQAHRHTTQ